MAVNTSFLMVLLLLVGGGLGSPSAVPPLPEDSGIVSAAPQECLLYAQWNGAGKPDPSSTNLAEQFYANPPLPIYSLAKSFVESVVNTSYEDSGIDEKEQTQLNKALEQLLIFYEQPWSVSITGVTPSPETLVAPEVAIVIKPGEKYSPIDTLLETVKNLGVPLPPIQESEVGSEKYSLIDLGEQKILFGYSGEYLIIANSEKEVQRVQKSLADKSAKPEWLAQLGKILDVERPSSIGYLNITKVIETATNTVPFFPIQQFAGQLGLDNIQSAAMVGGLDDKGVVSKTLLGMDGDPKGVLSFLATDGISLDDLKHIPEDVIMASVVELDLVKLINSIEKAVQTFDPQSSAQVDAMRSIYEQQLGVKLEEELLAALGTQWTIMTPASEGPLMFNGLTVSVNIRDRKKLVEISEKLRPMLEQVSAVDLTGLGLPQEPIGHAKIGDHTIYWSNSVPVLAPYWSLTEDRLVIGIGPNGVKSYLSKQDGRALVDNPDYAKWFSSDKKHLYFQYFNAEEMTKLVYPFVIALAPAFCAGLEEEGVHLDFTSLPTLSEIRPFLKPLTSEVYRTDAGIVTVSRGTLTTQSPLSLLLPLGFVTAVGQSATDTFSSVEKELVEPLDVPFEPDDKFQPK